VGGTIYNTHTLKPFKKMGLDSQGVKKLASKLHVHSVNYAAKLVHTRHALSSTVINSHQESILGQACNPLDPHWFFLSFSRWRSFTVLGTKVTPFLNWCGEWLSLPFLLSRVQAAYAFYKFAAKLVHTRCAVSSTITIFHQKAGYRPSLQPS